MIRFLAEVARKLKKDIYTTPSTEYSKEYDIYELDISEPPSQSYWTFWGGWYDEYVGTNIELYYERYLTRVYSITDLYINNFTFMLASNKVLFNIPKQPWFYPNHSVEVNDLLIFLSSSLNPNNASNNYIRNVIAPVRLEVPNFTIKLSDTIAGISLNQSFGISLHNSDGYFDDDILWNIFNTPIYLKKAIVENPEYDDFKTIRTGVVENTATNFDNFQIDVSDNFKSLEEPICNVIEQKDYSITIDESNLYKSIPIVYGTKKVKLLKLDDTHYIAAEYVTNIGAVYDSEGNSISYTLDNNIITADKADSALVTGYTNNKIGEIILDLITRKTNIVFNDTYYNIAEINNYINTSSRINIVLKNGNVKKAIQTVLKNDLAFFIQQINGKFTIRKYGKEYGTHTIPSWAITKKPEKNYDTAQENYFSSCSINYNYIDDNQFSSYLYNESEDEAEKLYQKKVLKTFDTELISINDVKTLSKLLSERYTKLKQTLKIAIGIDTTDFELLDTVILDMTINGRKFSNGTKYYIKEINPSQDILTLEEIE